MDLNALFIQMALKSLAITFCVEVVLILIYVIRKWKGRKEQSFWWFGAVFVFAANTLIFCITFFCVILMPIKENEIRVQLEPEVITEVNIIEKEKVIDVPSIMLPLEPEGDQAIIIDTTSTEMETFMEGFYGENVYFFNNRQEATFLVDNEGLVNYSGLDINEIEYDEEYATTTIQVDNMSYETVWVFSDLTHIDITSSKTKVILYVPRQLTAEEIQDLKQKNRDITIISIEQIC